MGGVSAQLTQHVPYVQTYPYEIYTSRAYVQAWSEDGFKAVEVGWLVFPEVYGDTLPHLYVRWRDGSTECLQVLNYACGWVQVSSTRTPGMILTATETPQQYLIEYVDGNWWVAYQSQFIGYFPASVFSESFSRMGSASWFGQVDIKWLPSCAEMGNGLMGAHGGPLP